MEVLVLTISDRASAGVYEDRSGPAIENTLLAGYPDAIIRRKIVPDEPGAILSALKEHAGVDFVFTTGGTGIGPRDITPETTQSYCEKMLPGIADTLRAESYKETPQAMISRGVAGMKGNTIIVNFPGSVRGATLCGRIMIPVMQHIIDMRDGGGH